MKDLKILIACEESQAICSEFRRLGYEAYSCDIQQPSGGHPEWHVQCNVFIIVRGDCIFSTLDGKQHYIKQWDLVVAHPPCTYLAQSGQRWCNIALYGNKARRRIESMGEAIRFFMAFTDIPCEHVAIENPVGIMSDTYRKPDQTIHPWMFGNPISKATCLWLKGLPALVPYTLVKPEIEKVEYVDRHGRTKRIDKFFYNTRYLPAEERRRTRSKTFPGIANAIAEQWSAYLESL